MKTILVVDDEKNIRFLYEEELRDEGYQVLTATNGREALEIVTARPVDLVLLDIRMPEMDGAEFLRRLREFDCKLPVIISTAYGDHVLQDFTAWLSDGYVVKAADLEALKAKVRQTLGD